MKSTYTYAWYVFGIKDEKEQVLYWADRVSDSDNLIPHCRGKHLIHVHHCPTKKEAWKTADFWNQCAKRNGNFMWEVNK